ncbi:MAG: 50S ribosomal protein L18a [Thermoplasmata archaeon]|nr:50S ribosomal protein L18a [Thermoplasmata archaeon]
MKAFKVSGTFLMGRDMQPFTKEVAAEDKNDAEEQVYSIMGSKHGVKRFRIKIENITPMKTEDVKDPVIIHKIGADK